ncbi:prophage PSPPH06 tail protein [Pseudomonas chlororaphis subsp. aurantiaca]|uniref:phage tail protein n=1 Tax=Pseudomonas chlororaphis TaxID=587753 RepID=UPI00086552E2|nr:phage tail protein [Pseudomonas chlororaphis]BAV77756.1 prophage PSPPH06 tail protein [Pseudomonas chlororaphis subsp. aurantiaca]
MIQLKNLSAFLKDRLQLMPDQFDSWSEQVDLDLVWRESERGLHMSNMRYRAVFSLERFDGSPSRLMALVGSWLEAHDPDRDRYGLQAPVFSIEPLDLDNDLFDVDLVLEFVEPQYLAEDPDGEIEAFGKTWSFIPFDLWIAEEGEVVSRDA